MKNKLIRARLLKLARKRGKYKTFCPSEIARSIDKENWRDLMHSVKLEGKKMVNENLLLCTQKGKPWILCLQKGQSVLVYHLTIVQYN